MSKRTRKYREDQINPPDPIGIYDDLNELDARDAGKPRLNIWGRPLKPDRSVWDRGGPDAKCPPECPDEDGASKDDAEGKA